MNKQIEPVASPRLIRRWACHKLECFGDYLRAYASEPGNRERYYLEFYAGSGRCRCAGTDCLIDDSALRALEFDFQRYIFVTGDDESAASLKILTEAQEDRVEIFSSNVNQAAFLRRFLDSIPRSAASFAFIDLPGYRALRWKTIERLARHGADGRGRKMDLLIVFPLEMALLRNLTRPDCEASINRLYGNNRWQEIRQDKLAGQLVPEVVRQRLVGLFKKNLKGLGYRYVEDFRPISFPRHPFYHLLRASDTSRGKKLLEAAWGKPRFLPCELLYNKDGSDG